MKHNILVLGGAGFIGSNLCIRLVKNKDNNVICLDNLCTGNKKNIQDCLVHSNFQFIEGNIIDGVEVGIPIHEIYNLACPASPMQYQKDPVFTAKTNVLGVLHALELARRYNAKFFQASTSEIYGNPLQHPQDEGYWGNVNPIGPRACYDEGKRMAETLCIDYHNLYGVDIRIARIFNTYGPRMHPNDGRVISSFVVRAIAGEPLLLFGNGTQTRSFCYIDDLLDGIELLMSSSVYEPVNLGNTEEITIKQLADIIIKKTHSKSIILPQKLPVDDPVRRKPDISKARRELGWCPRIPLEEGIDRSICYYKKNNR